MKADILTVEQALQRGKEFPWALIRTLERVSLGKTPEKIPTDGLLEARFFNQEEEIRIFSDGSGLHAARVAGGEERFLEKKYSLANPRFGTSITVRYILESDEDGQTYIAGSRLVEWEGENSHE